MKIGFIDTLGLIYNGHTLDVKGLGGSESAVILISRELAKLGFEVTVYNNCDYPGTYDHVRYVDHSSADLTETHDIIISSRSVFPFFANHRYAKMTNSAKHKILWMHDTFCQGDEHLEHMLLCGYIDEVFTLSDFHTNYVLNCDHGRKRNFEVLKHKFFQTRNGVVKRLEVDRNKKDKNLFVYNASATKGLVPLITKIWPKVKERIPSAKLTCIGGFYTFAPESKPDDQEIMVRKFMVDPNIKKMDVDFTGVITQGEIAEILAKASFTIYPTEFPETFGISTLESLLYRTPVITCRFGALEETALDLACYKIPYSTTNNAVFKNIDEENQARVFVDTVVDAYNNRYLYLQKQSYCEVVDDICGWDTIALQWKQHLYKKLGKYLYPHDFRRVTRINESVSRVFNRRFNDIENYQSFGPQRRIVVISPFWNAENYLKDHVLSVFQQEYDNYVHILINDASTDGSMDVIKDLSHDRLVLFENTEQRGAIRNQIETFKFLKHDDIVVLLDGDDSLVNNNTIFHYYNDLYDQGYDFTYGSMLSLADNIPLVAQDYPSVIHETKDYSSIRFPWGIPYTHLRTFRGELARDLDKDKFKVDGKWMMAGADNPLFYELIAKAKKPKAVKEIMVKYNDLNPLNDYKIRAKEQNQNAGIV